MIPKNFYFMYLRSKWVISSKKLTSCKSTGPVEPTVNVAVLTPIGAPLAFVATPGPFFKEIQRMFNKDIFI